MNLALLLDLQGARKRGNADRVNNNNNNERTALLAKRIKTDEDCKKSTHRQGFNGSSSLEDNIEELIYVGKVKNNRNNLNIMVTNPTGREFGRVNMKSLTGLLIFNENKLARLYCKQKWAYNISKFYKGKNIQLLRLVFELQRYDYYNLQDTDVADVFNTVISKLDKVPTQELSSHIKTELLRDNSRKFYRLVITSEDTHCKQTIKKAYIMSLERALLILFMI
ncbi:hypothetical protein HBI79_000090 [Parastagonospora nodorum]|nr:hypothetical protein HBI79_000090 [Parastagonospora nodorum]